MPKYYWTEHVETVTGCEVIMSRQYPSRSAARMSLFERLQNKYNPLARAMEMTFDKYLYIHMIPEIDSWGSLKSLNFPSKKIYWEIRLMEEAKND